MLYYLISVKLWQTQTVSAPYGAVKFMPTGGINPGNVCDYLANPKILCCGGSWMVNPDMIAAGDFAGIEKLVREAVDTMLGLKFRHVGINPCGTTSTEAAAVLANAFSFAAHSPISRSFAISISFGESFEKIHASSSLE